MADETFPTTIHTDVACTVCGCVCDDLKVHTRGRELVDIENACALAEPWFADLQAWSQQEQGETAFVHGEPVDQTTALKAAADILRSSNAPLIFGLSQSSTDGQRAAVALAEQLRCGIDTTASVCHGPSIMAIQQVGESTSSLGEVRHRADLVIFWGADPAESHPRHFERYSVDAIGDHIPRGRADRHVIVLDQQPGKTSALADEFIAIPPGQDFEVLWCLRQLIRTGELPTAANLPLNRDVLIRLAERLRQCRYGVFFFGLGLAQTSLGHLNVNALLQLTADLNRHTRFTARRLRIPGDVTGADAVLCWTTGFPFAVNLGREKPRYNPGEFTAEELLSRDDIDSCVIVGSDCLKMLSSAAMQKLSTIPTIAIDSPHIQSPLQPTVQFRTAVYGYHAAGTVYRMDETPLPLRQLVDTDLPTDGDILNEIRTRLD